MKLIRNITIIMCFFISSFFLINNLNTKENEKKETYSTIQEDEIKEMLNNLTLEEKIGQMLFINYQKSDKLTNDLKDLITTIHPGGFILFKENLKDYTTAQNFINNLQNSSSIPMFIGIDEEGGRVDRLTNIKNYTYSKIPPMLEIGNTKDENNAYKTGVTISQILQDFNINLDFAPVTDVLYDPNNTVIGNRSFGDDPYLVARMSTALAKGLSDNNIIPVYKHFPGHGNTTTDSHYELPIITKTKDELLKSDLIPFVNAIDNNAEIIMVGHLALPNITKDYTPASLSNIIITDILKNELGYQGIIITDALNMQAITKNYQEKETYELAINAGVDILLMPNNPKQAISLIKESINEGTITEENIDNSVYKILKLKKKYNILP